MQNETNELLNECNAGIKMGIDSIDDMLPYVSSSRLKEAMTDCKKTHQKLSERTAELLHSNGMPDKEIHLIAKGMSWLKTNVKLSVDSSDAAIADLLTDGCNMGVKSLNKYLNQYSNADKASADVAKAVIRSEEQLVSDVKEFL